MTLRSYRFGKVHLPEKLLDVFSRRESPANQGTVLQEEYVQRSWCLDGEILRSERSLLLVIRVH